MPPLTESTMFLQPFDVILHHTGSQATSNFVLTTLFIAVPMFFINLYNCYVHVSQEEIFPFMKKCLWPFKFLFYCAIFFPFSPIGPLFNYIENTYAQMKYTVVSSEVEGKVSFSKNSGDLD